MNKSTREKLNEKYYKLPKNKHIDNRNEKEFYMDYIKVLNNLLDDVVKLRKKEVCFLIKGFNRRQLGCIERITKEDNGWRNELDNFNQKYYELTDFIFYPGFEYGSLTQEEFSVIELMTRYLINLAENKINNIEKNN